MEGEFLDANVASAASSLLTPSKPAIAAAHELTLLMAGPAFRRGVFSALLLIVRSK
jgi:hypothetical protein